MIEVDILKLVQTITRRKLTNFVAAELAFAISRLRKRPVIWGQPYILTAEPSSRCNLNCPLCAVGARKLTRKQGLLDLEIYRKILDELGPYLFEILLFNQGEPFLNPDLVKMVHLAKQYKIYTTISTNGHFLQNAAGLNALIDSQPDVLLISLDGATPESYVQYRRGGNFETVLQGIRDLQSMKHEKRSRRPAVFLQFLVTRQNESEIPAARTLAKNLSADRILFKSLQVENGQEAAQFLPQTARFRRYSADGRLQRKRQARIVCSRLWRSTVLLSDGRIVPCCFDKNGQYHAGTPTAGVGLKQLWHGERYHHLRNQMLHAHQIGPICLNCTEGVKIYH